MWGGDDRWFGVCVERRGVLGRLLWLVSDPQAALMQAVSICFVGVIHRMLIFSAAQDDRRVEGRALGTSKGETLLLNGVLSPRCFGFPFILWVQGYYHGSYLDLCVLIP